MKLGIFAKTFSGAEPRAVLAQAHAAGFQAVQYNMACSGLGALPQLVSEVQAHAVARAAADAGVEIAALSATYNMLDPDPAKRSAGRSSFSALARAAKSIGTNILTVCSGSCDPQDQWRHHPDNASAASWKDMCGEFEQLIAIAEANNILIGVEPELGNAVSSAMKARELLDTFEGSPIRIVLDPANLFEVEEPTDQRRIVADAVALLADKIVLAHAKDRHADGRFATAGKGVLDWPHYIKTLRAAGFNGALITHGLGPDEAHGVARFLVGLL